MRKAFKGCSKVCVLGWLFSAMLAIVLLVLMAFFFLDESLGSSWPTPPTPLDHQEMVYWIGRMDYYPENYCVRYRYGGDKGCIPIRNSEVDLSPFEGERVRVYGDFPRYLTEMRHYFAIDQCIEDDCHHMFGNNPDVTASGVVDIECVALDPREDVSQAVYYETKWSDYEGEKLCELDGVEDE